MYKGLTAFGDIHYSVIDIRRSVVEYQISV